MPRNTQILSTRPLAFMTAEAAPSPSTPKPSPDANSHAAMSAMASEHGLLASAIAGRRTSVQRAEAGELGRWAFSDGQGIALPHLENETSADDEWLCVVSQALLIAGGSLHPALLRRLLVRPPSIRRYAALEVLRVAHQLSDRVPQRFMRELERMRLGSPLPHAQASVRKALSDSARWDIPDFIGTVRPGAVFRNQLSGGGWSAWLSPSTSAGASPAEPSNKQLHDDDPGESSKALRLFNNPFGGNGMVSDLLKQLLGMGASSSQRESASDGAGGDEMPVGRIERAWRRGAQAVRAQLGQQAPDDESVAAAPRRFSYPEWDLYTGRYKPAWASVEEVAPHRPDGLNASLLTMLGSPSLRMRRGLTPLSQDFEMHGRQRDGAEFDEGRLIDYAVDLQLGISQPTPDVYRASRKTRRDLGVMIVVDASGSTAECNARGESVFMHLSTAAFRMARSFDLLGDRVALFGFHSWGRRLVHLVRIKGHEEPWSSRVSERMAQLDAVGFTRLGAAIRHADDQLRTQIRLPHRLMILVTDGLSYDTDYEGSYAEEDTRRALAQAHANGTACVCVCIGGGQAAQNLARVFHATQLLMLDSVDELDARIGPACLRALQAASRRSTASRSTLAPA